MLLVQVYSEFVDICEKLDVPPKYVLFSVVSSLLAAFLSIGVRASGKGTWLCTKCCFYALRGIYRFFLPKPNELGGMVLESLEKAGYFVDENIEQLIGRGCSATYVKKTKGVQVTVDGRNITTDLCKTTLNKLKERFNSERKNFNAELKKAFLADEKSRIEHTKKKLIRAKAMESI